jgi:hypothetical protein
MIKNKVAHNSSKIILDEVDSLDHYLQTIVQAIELGKNWNEQEALNLEIKKSFVRGLIRYSHNSFKLIEFLCGDLKNLSKKNKDPLRWVTPFYPMIHLSNDKVEGGSFHNDNLDMKNFLLGPLFLSILFVLSCDRIEKSVDPAPIQQLESQPPLPSEECSTEPRQMVRLLGCGAYHDGGV